MNKETFQDELLEQIIKTDKNYISQKLKHLIKQELYTVISNYLNVDEFDLKILYLNNSYTLTLTTKANRIKNINLF